MAEKKMLLGANNEVLNRLVAQQVRVERELTLPLIDAADPLQAPLREGDIAFDVPTQQIVMGNDVLVWEPSGGTPPATTTLTSAGGTQSLVSGPGTGPALLIKGLSAGTGVALTSDAVSVTVATVQDIAPAASPTFAHVNVTNTSNQLTLGTGANTTTLTAPTPAASAVYTIPDTGTATARFVMTEGAQTISGTTNLAAQGYVASAGGLTYAVNTASQAANTVTGTGTTFTSAMVGGVLVFADGTAASITGFTSTTELTAQPSQVVAAQAYTIYYGGRQSAGGYTAVSGLNMSGVTASTIAAFDANKNLITANTAAAPAIFGIGTNAGAAFTLGTRNYAIGNSALAACAVNTDNIAVGDQALLVCASATPTLASLNIGVGSSSGINITTGIENTACGAFSLYWNNTGNENSAFGARAMGLHATSAQTPLVVNNNSAFGSHAMMFHASGDFNTAVGTSALRGSTPATISPLVNTNSSNACLGVECMNHNHASTQNCAMGRDCMKHAGTASSNCIGGYQAMNCPLAFVLTNAPTSNTSWGHQSLRPTAGTACTLSLNSAYGFQSMTTVAPATTGCVAIGSNTLKVTTASSLTALGASALAANTSGTGNTAGGFNSLLLNNTGSNNTAYGDLSGNLLTTGSGNTIVGANADVGANNHINCLILGANAVSTTSSQLVLGSAGNPLNTATTVGAAGTASAPPAQPRGYLALYLNGLLVKIPYYNN